MTEQQLMIVDSVKKYFEKETNLVDRLMGKETDSIMAVDDVSFELEKEETIGIIGESGCGKTTLLNTIAGLNDPTEGTIEYKGQDIDDFGKKGWKEYRSEVQVIFQDPFNSLDPKFTVEEILLEPLKIHGVEDRQERLEKIMEDVNLLPPEQFLNKYPHQLSGGEQQRVSIARALILEPELILADEPVSMLDVSIQADVLKMLSDLTDKYGVSLIYISHDLSTVSYLCDDIYVMYLGRFVESSPTEDLIRDPKHPYSQALINAIPVPDPNHNRTRTNVDGTPQDPVNIGEGCRFRDRCPEKHAICEKTPLDIETGAGRTVACHLYYEHEEYTDTEIEQEMGDA